MTAAHESDSLSTLTSAERLRSALGDLVHLPGDPGYESARVPWNLAIDQRPFAIASPRTAEEVVDIVRVAAGLGMRLAPQSTGHAAAALAESDLSHAILVSMRGLRGVTVNPSARTARVLGGSHWNDVIAETAPHGLTALHGSAGDVSVAGYCLSGGLSFYARRHGLAVNAVRSVTVVTADAQLITASESENADLFWALRGGSGAFGIVVSLEIELLPYADVYAGMLLWNASRASEIAHAWREWTLTAPETATTSLRIMHFPPMPELPPFLSGRSVVVVDGAVLETDEAATDLLQPLRALGPEIDTFARMPSSGLVAVHMDPPMPTASVTGHAMLAELPAEAIDAFVAASVVPGPMLAELRHVGGAASLRPPHAGAVGSVPDDYLLAAIGMIPVPAAIDLARSLTSGLVATMAPWETTSRALTFIDGDGVDRAGGFGDAADRLADLKRAFDPDDMFAAAHPVD